MHSQILRLVQLVRRRAGPMELSSYSPPVRGATPSTGEPNLLAVQLWQLLFTNKSTEVTLDFSFILLPLTYCITWICSETTLTGESQFHISPRRGFVPGSLVTGSIRVVHWTSETWWEWSEITGLKSFDFNFVHILHKLLMKQMCWVNFMFKSVSSGKLLIKKISYPRKVDVLLFNYFPK